MICDAQVPTGGTVTMRGLLRPAMRRCGAPAVAVHDYGCVHEHVKRRASCVVHAPVPGEVGCWSCLQEGHECEMSWQEVAVSEAKDDR